MRSGHKKSVKLDSFPLSVVFGNHVQRKISQVHANTHNVTIQLFFFGYFQIAKFFNSKEKSQCFLVCLTYARCRAGVP
jgi:hypothetical protein